MKQYRFKARLEAGDGGGAFILFPYDVEKEFGTKGRVPVKSTFNGVSYTGSLFKYGYPQHVLGVSKAIRQEIGKAPGDTIQVVLWKDESTRIVEVPPPLQKALQAERLLPVFNQLSYTHRKEYCRWIADAKKEETRSNRLRKAVAMLRKGVKTPG